MPQNVPGTRQRRAQVVTFLAVDQTVEVVRRIPPRLRINAGQGGKYAVQLPPVCPGVEGRPNGGLDVPSEIVERVHAALRPEESDTGDDSERTLLTYSRCEQNASPGSAGSKNRDTTARPPAAIRYTSSSRRSASPSS